MGIGEPDRFALVTTRGPVSLQSISCTPEDGRNAPRYLLFPLTLKAKRLSLQPALSRSTIGRAALLRSRCSSLSAPQCVRTSSRLSNITANGFSSLPFIARSRATVPGRYGVLPKMRFRRKSPCLFPGAASADHSCDRRLSARVFSSRKGIRQRRLRTSKRYPYSFFPCHKESA